MSGGQLYENLRQLITVVDELRDVGLQNYISLPRIATCGTQSSGKSSLVESVVGIDFLPRGGGVVTRRPLELRLVHLNHMDYPKETSWAVFDQTQKKYENFDDVTREIDRLTDEVAGANKGIVDDPITLTVYSTNAPDLTMIDLPGITRVSLKGSDQVEDIEKLTREMTLRYIKDPRTIVLAVLPANQDMSVSDALQMARQVDPQGIRTIGVITKIDIMDQGTDATRMLKGEDIPLRLGYVGVKMRSQADIDAKKRVKDAIDDEKTYFETHRLYSKLPPGLVGTGVLIEKLTKVLFKHIRRFLPEIKREIGDKRRAVQDRLDELGDGVPLEVNQCVQLMWTMITDFCEMFKNTIRGKFDRKLQKYLAAGSGDAAAVSGGSQLRSIFTEFLADFTEETITARMTDDDIDNAIRMHEGDSLPGFPSPDTFEFLILPHLRKLVMPSVECVNNVASCLDQLAKRLALNVFRRFPKLAEAVLEMIADIIQRERETTRIIVEHSVASETGYLFTNDEEYLTSHGSMQRMYEEASQKPAAPVVEEKPPEPGQVQQALLQGASIVQDVSRQAMTAGRQIIGNDNSPGARQRMKQRYSGPFVNEIRRRLDAYFLLVCRNVRDAVPKTVGYFLVRQVQEKMQYELLQSLNVSEKVEELLGEPAHIREERKSLSNQLQVLAKAHNVLTRDPTLAAIAFDAEDEVQSNGPTNGPAQPARPKPQATSPTSGAGMRPPGAPGAPGAPGGYGAPGAGMGGPAPAAVPSRPAPAPTGGGGLFGGPPAAPKPGGGLFGGPAAAPKPGMAKNPLRG
jgi:dynamin 1-like protein